MNEAAEFKARIRAEAAAENRRRFPLTSLLVDEFRRLGCPVKVRYAAEGGNTMGAEPDNPPANCRSDASSARLHRALTEAIATVPKGHPPRPCFVCVPRDPDPFWVRFWAALEKGSTRN